MPNLKKAICSNFFVFESWKLPLKICSNTLLPPETKKYGVYLSNFEKPLTTLDIRISCLHENKDGGVIKRGPDSVTNLLNAQTEDIRGRVEPLKRFDLIH